MRSRMRGSRRTPVVTGVALWVASLVLTACGASGSASGSATPTSTPPVTSTTLAPATSTITVPAHPAFAFYYLWWDTKHWHVRLGPNFPYAKTPLPLPATLTGDGCTVVNQFAGNQLTDVPPQLWTQDDPARIRADVALAAKAGLAGFAVGWAGTGQPHQSAASSAFNRRLASLVAAVHQVNAAGTPFKLWIAYMSSAASRTLDYMNNDLKYLQATYGTDSAFDHSNRGRPTLVMMGSRKYPQWFLDAMSRRWRPSFYLVGDENWDTWNRAKAADFDADQYYWSSQNPTTNPGSFALVAQLAHLNGKPAPDTYLAASDALGVPPARAAVFEDALAGVSAAKAGGFGFVVGVDRVGQADALREHGADVVVQDLGDLLD